MKEQSLIDPSAWGIKTLFTGPVTFSSQYISGARVYEKIKIVIKFRSKPLQFLQPLI